MSDVVATTIDTQLSGYPTDKATAAANEILAQATAIANPAKPTKPAAPMPPTPDGATPALPETGILAMHQSAASIRGYYVSNVWQAPVGDGSTYLQVSAGATRNQDGSLTDDGIVAIMVLVRDDLGVFVPDDNLQAYESPGRDGPLSIVAVDGDVVQLRTAQGSRIMFDLASRLFR